MTPIKYIKRLVLLAFIIEVTSHPTSYGGRLINFLENGGNNGGSGSNSVSGSSSGTINGWHSDPGNYDNERRHHQRNVETGSDSSLVEISFQPLRELESVSAPSSPSSSSSSLPLSLSYPLRGKQFFDENLPLLLESNLLAALSKNQRNFHRQLRTYQRPPEDNKRHHHQPYPDESSDESSAPASASASATRTTFSSSTGVNGLNEMLNPEEDNFEIGGPIVPMDFMRRDLQGARKAATTVTASNEEEKDAYDDSMENYGWHIFKRQQHPLSVGLAEAQQLFNYEGDDANSKRNALAAFKRQKFKSHQTQFIPSISVGAMTNLGEFFKNLKNNIEFMEKGKFSGTEEQLLEGDHPISLLREELSNDGTKPTGTAAFLHAIRTYRPSQRIRSLVSLNPEGYHGSQFLDPNYMWVGMGKRK